MSKPKEEELLKNQNDPDPNSPGGNNAPAGNNPNFDPLKDKDKDNSGFPTIEEHQKNLNVGAPVFAAVMQSERWADGKRVPEEVFKKAVEGFLNASMGGNN